MAWTLKDIKTKVQQDMDLEDEQFITTSEFVGYVNEAIREAEAEIHKLSLEDSYFLSNAPLTFVQGVGEYALPDDIYATKIRWVRFENGDRQYDITRFRGVRALADFMYWRRYGTATTNYKYLLTNKASEGVRIALSPLAYESGDYGTIWYIRNAKQLLTDLDECDIPEFINFIIQFVKDRCINKERMTPDAPESQALLAQRKLMIDTLSEQVPDGDNELERDLSHYEDSI